MLTPPTQEQSTSLMALEGLSTCLVVAISFLLPNLGNRFFASIERTLAPLARRKSLAVTAVGLTAFVLRLAILPFCPIPLPFLPDDFSFLLAADTFAHGRLTNPTPAMWMHFESIHVTMNPSYMSMYFPSNGLLLAASEVLFGHPWFGLLIMNSLMCAALCWMLQAWLPPTWALLGGLIAIVRIGLFSYFINTYTGGACITALGGALILGALPRILKTARLRDGFLMAVGIILLALTRPYEGLLLCLPVAAVLLCWIFGYTPSWLAISARKPSPAPPISILMRRAALPLAMILASLSWLAYYDYRAFGKATTLPYTINRTTYAVAPYFIWQNQRPDPGYRHNTMRRFYYENELPEFVKIHTIRGFAPMTAAKALRILIFYSGVVFLLLVFFLRRILLDRRIRFLALCVGVLAAGLVIQIYVLSHYVAPFIAAFYAMGLQAMRHLRVWQANRQPAGRTILRLSLSLCVLLGVVRLFATPLHLDLTAWPPFDFTGKWYGMGHFGTQRAAIAADLAKLPGNQLVLVRYSSTHNPIFEWVYNAADIDHSKVIWARDMDAAKNAELLNYYKDRQVWLVEPDTQPATLTPYRAPAQLIAASH